MKKRMYGLLAALGALLAVIGYGYKRRYAASIGIIGGADGPTAIFIAGKTGFLFYAGIGLLAAVIAVGIVYVLQRRKK